MLTWKRFKSCNADKRGINQGNVAISSYVGKQVLFHSMFSKYRARSIYLKYEFGETPAILRKVKYIFLNCYYIEFNSVDKGKIASIVSYVQQ